MKYYTYILFGNSINKYYTGYTHNINLRLKRLNSGYSKSTKRDIPWELVYVEEFDNKPDSLKREREIKNKKSRKYIEKLVHAEGRPDQ